MNSKLKIYFYHTRLTRESYEEWKDFRFPGHILYGLPLLENTAFSLSCIGINLMQTDGN